MVSAALVTVRSSGSLVGGLEELRLICTLTVEPLGRGARTALKSWPSTTWTSWPIPVTRSIFDWPNTAATVAAACSLPGEKHCGGQQRTRVVVRSHHVEAVPLELIGGGGGQTGLAGRVRDLHCDLFWRGRRNLLVLNLVGQTRLRRFLVVVGGVDGVLPRRWAL